MIFLLVILTLIVFCGIIILFMNLPGCTGSCMQGKYECDCPLKESKNDIRQDKRP
jgi:hypothetical protein